MNTAGATPRKNCAAEIPNLVAWLRRIADHPASFRCIEVDHFREGTAIPFPFGGVTTAAARFASSSQKAFQILDRF